MDQNTDRDWESLATTDPYWAVISVDEFRRGKLTPEALERFFLSGVAEAESIVSVARARFDAPKQIDVCLDFGCGVGRILLGLARFAKAAVGVDVSPTMLDLCNRNARERGIENIELFRSDDQLSAVSQYSGTVDLLTSFIVFQHIPPQRGYRILDALLKLLKAGGVGCLQFTFAAEVDALRHENGNVTGVLHRFYQRTPGGLLKLVEYPAGDTQIQMNHYNLNELFCYLYQIGATNCFVQLDSHSGTLGATLYFQKGT